MRSLLVTGGAGFIGSEFVRQTIAAGDVKVTVLDALTYAGDRANLAGCESSEHFYFVEGHIGEQSLVSQLLVDHQVDAVLNLAAETHVDRSIARPQNFVRSNVMATCQLLDGVLAYWQSLSDRERDTFRFVQVSTDEVYGQLGQTGLFTESSPYAPRSPYAASKGAADHFVRAYHHTYGLPTIVTASSNNYGPCQFPEKLIPLMIVRALRGESLPVYGTGKNVRDWLHVSDHGRGLRRVLERGVVGESYHLGGGVEKTNLEIVHEICQQMERLVPEVTSKRLSDLIEFVDDRPGHDFRYALDSTKAHRELDWRPTVDFTTGMAQTVQWYLDNRSWVDAALRRIKA